MGGPQSAVLESTTAFAPWASIAPPASAPSGRDDEQPAVTASNAIQRALISSSPSGPAGDHKRRQMRDEAIGSLCSAGVETDLRFRSVSFADISPSGVCAALR
jgi:hypothetical protein